MLRLAHSSQGLSGSILLRGGSIIIEKAEQEAVGQVYGTHNVHSPNGAICLQHAGLET